VKRHGSRRDDVPERRSRRRGLQGRSDVHRGRRLDGERR
jgi:hypothetical protein